MSGRVYKKNWRRWKKYGQKKAAASQTDLAKVVLKQNTVFTAKYDAASKKGVAAINVWDVLANNPTFINNKKNYDQVKINLASVKLTVADAVMTAASASQIKSYQIILAWDRTGLSEGQYDFNVDAETKKVLTWDCKVGEAVAGYSSAKKSQLNSFQRWNAWMGIGAKNILERGMYFSTDLISAFNGAQNATTGTITLANQDYPVDYWYNNANPCVPIEMASVPFKPTLLVGVFASGFDSTTGAVNKYADTPPVVFNAEWSFDITYRGIRGTI